VQKLDFIEFVSILFKSNKIRIWSFLCYENDVFNVKCKNPISFDNLYICPCEVKGHISFYTMGVGDNSFQSLNSALTTLRVLLKKEIKEQSDYKLYYGNQETSVDKFLDMMYACK